MAFGRLRKSQGDCCTVNEGKWWDLSQRGRQVPQHRDVEDSGQDRGSYSSCNGKLLVGSQQRGDVVGLMLLMITLMLWKEQSMRAGDKRDEQSTSRSRETKSRLPWWFGWAVLVAGRASVQFSSFQSLNRVQLFVTP